MDAYRGIKSDGATVVEMTAIELLNGFVTALNDRIEGALSLLMIMRLLKRRPKKLRA